MCVLSSFWNSASICETKCVQKMCSDTFFLGSFQNRLCLSFSSVPGSEFISEQKIAPKILRKNKVLWRRYSACFIFLHLVWIDIVDLLGGLRDRKLLITVSTHTLVRPLRLAVLGGVRLLSSSCSPSDAYSTVADSSSSSTVDEYTLGYDLNRFIFKTTVNGDDSAVLRRQRR